MKNWFLFLSIMVMVETYSQTRTRLSSDSAIEVWMVDSNVIDLDPSLISLDKQPVPAGEYGDLKQKLYLKRKALNSKKKNDFENKSSTANTVKIKIEKGFEANIPTGHPADNDVAISNGGMIVSAVNSNLYFYDSNDRFLSQKSLTSLASSIGNYARTSDPRLLYDPHTDRFVICFFSGSTSATSTIIVGFSQTNDPTAKWNMYKINGNPFNDSTWSDYPIMALNGSDLFITFNQVKDNIHWSEGFKQSVIYQIDKSQGYQSKPLQYELWSDLKYQGRYLRNICPAKPQTLDVADEMYFLTVRNVDTANDSIFVIKINNALSSQNSEMTQFVLKAPTKYGFPPNAIQAKNKKGIEKQLMTNDARVLSAIYQNNTIHFGLNSIHPKYLNAAVYLGRIENVSAPTPKVYAELFSDQSYEYGYPSMAHIDHDSIPNRVIYTFSHCATNGFPGTSVLYQNARGAFGNITHIKKGDSVIDILVDSAIERWGDYTNAQKIYNNPKSAIVVGSWGGKYNIQNTRMLTWVAKVSVNDTVMPLSSISEIEQSTQKDIVYPMPISDRFSTQIHLTQNENLKFTLLDINGRMIQHIMTAEGYPGRNDFSINVAPLAKGIYYLHILGDRGTDRSLKIQK